MPSAALLSDPENAPMEDTTQKRWHRAQAVFDRALDLPPEARLAYLEKTCRLDETLRLEVEELLRATSPAENFLEVPLSNLIQAMLAEVGAAEAAERMIGRRIGPYRLREHIGSGGMGAVYLAERETPYRQRVALKLIRPGADRAEAFERFRSERQILAELEHAGIAHILDGGVTEPEAGMPEQPYFVMEYVDGEAIDVYCDRHRLSVTERLKLFRAVCEAVQYAHQNLVIHRDLKPSNILVTKEGEVKLLDFGIAQVMEAESTGDGAALASPPPTQMMTPEYAAPEQVQGKKITTAADVYVLGVLLYELLTGHRPYQPKNHLRCEVERVVVGAYPLPPSAKIRTSEEGIGPAGEVRPITPEAVSQARSTRPGRLARRLRGDLDCIARKALRKAPEHRYVSAEQLSEDVRRHLEGLAVEARQGTTAYRIAKFVQRHRVGVAAAVLIILSLTIGLGYALEQERVAAAERDRAEWAAAEAFREKQKAERVTAFIVSVFQGAGSTRLPSQSVKASDLLRQGAKRVEIELRNDPEVQAEMLEVLGQVYRSLTLYEEAMPLLERALSLQRARYKTDHPKIASTLHELALLYQRSGHYDLAEPLFQEALAIRRRLYHASAHPDVAESLSGLAGLYHRKDRYGESESLYREALWQQEALYGAHHEKVAKTLENLGRLFRSKGQYAEAEAALRRALAIRQRFPEKKMPIMNASLHMGGLLVEMGAYDEAEPILRDIQATWKGFYGDHHIRTAVSSHVLAELLHGKGEYAEAEVFYREALAIRRAIFGDVHASTSITATLLADVLAETGAFGEADSLYRFALAGAEGSFSEEHARMSYPYLGLGRLRLRQRQFAEAEQHLREALRLRQQMLPANHPATAVAAVWLGRCLVMRGRAEEAGLLFEQGYATLQSRLGHEHAETQRARRWIEERPAPENTLTEMADEILTPATIENE